MTVVDASDPASPTTKFGLIYVYLDSDRLETRDPARRNFEVHWAECIDHMVWAEELGFDSIWFNEHHFEAGRPSHAPSPLLLAGALAMRTSRVRISQTVALAPLYHPLRLAEEAAMVSVLSNGRYDLGIGTGYTPIEFEAFGVNMKHRPSLLEDTVAIARKAWTGEKFSHRGKRFQIPEIEVHPVPTRTPRILIGASVDVAIKRAARIGDGFVSAQNHDIATYVDALAEYGRQGAVFAGQQAVIAEDPDRAITEQGQYALRYCNDLIARGYVDPNIVGRDRFESLREAVDAGVYTLWDGPTAVSTITELIRTYPQIEDVSFMVQSGPGEPLESTSSRVQYIADYVVPQIRKNIAAVAPTSAKR